MCSWCHFSELRRRVTNDVLEGSFAFSIIFSMMAWSSGHCFNTDMYSRPVVFCINYPTQLPQSSSPTFWFFTLRLLSRLDSLYTAIVRRKTLARARESTLEFSELFPSSRWYRQHSDVGRHNRLTLKPWRIRSSGKPPKINSIDFVSKSANCLGMPTVDKMFHLP